LDLESGDIAGAEPQRQPDSRLVAGRNQKAVPGADDLVEAAVLAALLVVDGHPDRVDAVGVRSADRAGDGVDLSRADRVLIDGERQLRRAGAFAFAQARRREQEDYRP